jgi:Holliday junction DNA helicase RuvA
MIAYIEGKLAEKAPTHVVIDCNGVGYFIKISLHTFQGMQEEEGRVKLLTHLQVREDAHTLYGFAEKKEQDVFLLLISVSGVGANTALSILSHSSPEELAEAIHAQKVNSLKNIKGIGQKTAERIVLELKDKISQDLLGGNIGNKSQHTPSHVSVQEAKKKDEAILALTQLGFNRAQMEARITELLQVHGNDIAISELIRLAMRQK